MAINLRKTAANMLLNIEKNGAYINIEMNNLRKEASHSERDIRLIGEIVNGVIKRKLSLDYVISLHSSTKLKKISPYVLNVLRIGVYQLLFMDKIPPSAAVDECVKAIKKSSVSRLSGYVNAVLRAVKSDDLSELSEENAEGLSIKYSYPLWLVKRWEREFGPQFTKKLLISLNKKSPLYIRCNTLVNSLEEFKESLNNAGIEYEEVRLKNFKNYNYSFKLSNIKDISRVPGFNEGSFYIQDPAASLAAYLLEPNEEDFIIDLCAAPGGKSLFLAALVNNNGKVIACDIFEHKLKLISENAKKCKATSVVPTLNDASVLKEEWINTADRVLCDVPCSGFGIIRKKPDIKYARKEEDIKALSELSLTILENGAKYLKNNGVLVFSTCTIEKEENQDVINEFLKNHSEFSIYPFGDNDEYKDGFYTSYPNITDTDGFFICRLRKAASPPAFGGSGEQYCFS